MESQSTVPSSQSSSTRGQSGVCSECGATFKLVQASGFVWKHGHGHGRPFCLASDRLPASHSIPDLSSSADRLDSSQASSLDASQRDALLNAEFTLPSSPRQTLRRIPRGVRQKAALTFENCLRKVLATPDDLGSWRSLFQFAECLSQPVRGGKRQNLTSQISSQIDRVAGG